MPTGQPVDVLLAHDRWATTNVLEACASLPPEQFHQSFEMGPGSLHDTITHMLAAMQAWGDMLAGREIRERLEGEQRTAEQLLTLHHEVSDEFEQAVRAHPIDESVTAERRGQSFTFARGGVLTHVTTHGMHHRAQCLNMLRQLGVEKLPPNSVVEWMLMADGPA